MELDNLYRAARSRHGNLGMDAAHDLICKLGADLPGEAYVRTCIRHAKPEPVQQLFELEEDDVDQDQTDVLHYLAIAIENTRDRYAIEVDTFLECCVNSTYKAFGERTRIARSTLEKICRFARHEILTEFHRISE